MEEACSVTAELLEQEAPSSIPVCDCLVFSSGDRDPSVAPLHSLTTGKDYYVTMPDPPFRTRYIVGSSHGWLITADERSNLLLVNPATQAQIAMPPPETIKNVKIRCNSEGVPEGYDIFKIDLFSSKNLVIDTEGDAYDVSWDEGRFYFYVRVVLSADPSSGNCTIMIVHLLDNLISFARVGATHWTWVNVSKQCWDYHDVLYNNDDRLFYAVTATGDVHTIDTNGLSPMLRVVFDNKSSLIDCTKYIVQSGSGDLLQLWRFGFREVGAFHLEDSSFTDLLPIGSRLNWPPPIWFRPSYSSKGNDFTSDPVAMIMFFPLTTVLPPSLRSIDTWKERLQTDVSSLKMLLDVKDQTYEVMEKKFAASPLEANDLAVELEDDIRHLQNLLLEKLEFVTSDVEWMKSKLQQFA
uniref:KIB1-4 beta-propeller domain-containing protein n=1 Tax=Leersia perrieri TaxID=77586 RepID=A0A0D9V0C5_9ORYZ